MPIIALGYDELCRAVALGKERNRRSVGRGSRPNHGAQMADAEAIHITGAFGEFAAAKCLGHPEPSTVDTFKAPDLDGGIQVRTRNTTNAWKNAKTDHLIVRSDDPDDQRFVLVTVMVPYFNVRGWIWGRDCKRDEFLYGFGDRPKAWFVPPAGLEPMSAFADDELLLEV